MPGAITLTSAVIIPVVIALFFVFFLVSRYKRCASNEILVIFGKVGGGAAAKCIHGGGAFVWPIIQDYKMMSLEPMSLDIKLDGALSANAIRVNVPSTFTIAISKDPVLQQEASVRLLGLSDSDIMNQAGDIILGQLRLAIASLTIEEINQDRDKFLSKINEEVGSELAKIGLEVINVNITDLTDHAGYIEAIGKKAASAAINQALIAVAEQEKLGAIGTSTANREKEIAVALEQAKSAEGIATAEKTREIAVAMQSSQQEQGRMEAEKDQRVRVAELESNAVDGENRSKALIAEAEAKLAVKRAEANQTSKVAEAEAKQKILLAEKEEEVAKLKKEIIAGEEIEKEKQIINAEAEAEQIRRIAKGKADAILLEATAVADGEFAKYQAIAKGFDKIITSCGGSADSASQMLIIEKMPELMAIQTDAIKNIKMDKVVVWGGGNSGSEGGVGSHIKDVMSVLPPLSETMGLAGLKLPQWLAQDHMGVDAEATDETVKSDDTDEA